jgi:hypothetical protein
VAGLARLRRCRTSERNPDAEGLRVYFDRGDEADYWQGETPPTVD